ncbi:phage integrase central domain-containing protein [Sphingobium indicum]
MGSGSSTRFCRWIAQVSSDRLPLLRSLKVPFGTVQQSYRTTVIRSLEGDLFDMIGAIPIADFTPPLILAVLREIKARGAIETTERVRQHSGVLVYSIAQGITQTDPAEKLGAVLKPLRKGRQPAITDLVPLRKMILVNQPPRQGYGAVFATSGARAGRCGFRLPVRRRAARVRGVLIVRSV